MHVYEWLDLNVLIGSIHSYDTIAEVKSALKLAMIP